MSLEIVPFARTYNRQVVGTPFQGDHFGIRPEHTEISTTEGLWKGTVGVAEHLGSDTFIHIHGIDGCYPMTVRTSGDVIVNHGDTVSIRP